MLRLGKDWEGWRLRGSDLMARQQSQEHQRQHRKSIFSLNSTVSYFGFHLASSRGFSHACIAF